VLGGRQVDNASNGRRHRHGGKRKSQGSPVSVV
jgi:hypothetical protein